MSASMQCKASTEVTLELRSIAMHFARIADRQTDITVNFVTMLRARTGGNRTHISPLTRPHNPPPQSGGRARVEVGKP